MSRRSILFTCSLIAAVVSFHAQPFSREQRINLESLIKQVHNAREPKAIFSLCDKIISIDSANSTAVLFRALTYGMQQEYKTALRYFNLYLEKKPRAQVYMHRAQMRLNAKDTAGAMQDVEKAMTLSNYSAESGEFLDYFYRKLKRDRKIETYYEKIAKRHPNNITCLSVLGIFKDQRNDFEGSSKKFGRAIKVMENEVFFGRRKYYYLFGLKANADFKIKHYQEAIDAISIFILLNPDQPNYYQERIAYYLAAGDNDKACMDVKYLQSLDKNYISPFQISCENSKENTELQKKWKKKVEAEKFYIKASTYLRINDSANINAAISCYSKAFELNPKHIYALGARAAIYLNNKQYQKAIEDLNRVLVLKPACAKAHHYRAEAKRNLSKYKEALDDEIEAVRLDSTNIEYLTRRGALENSIGDTVSAIADLSKALALDSSYATAWYDIGRLHLYYQKNYPAALYDFSKAIELCENTPFEEMNSNYYSFRARAYEGLLMHDKALLEVDKAIALDTSYAAHYYLSGEIKARLKDMKGACVDWNMAKKLGHAKVEELLLYNCSPEEEQQKKLKQD